MTGVGTRRDHTRRFEGRAEAYARFRPRYPPRIIDILRAETGFDSSKKVADIGSGTGILSEVFLEAGNKVYCVEPNGEMRAQAEEALGKYSPLFVSKRGTAERTGLARSSIDLAVVGQALHWFDLVGARREFRRFLKRPGRVAIIYNHRREQGAVEEAYSRIIEEYSEDRAQVPDADETYIARFLPEGVVKKFLTPNSQVLSLEGMVGRLCSASYMPRPGEASWPAIERDVREIFRRLSRGGVVTLHYDTVVHLGMV